MSDTFSNFPSWWIEYSKDKTGAEWEIGSAIWMACFAAWNYAEHRQVQQLAEARAEIERLKEENGNVHRYAAVADEDLAQRDKDWNALMILIAATVGTEEEREAAELDEMEEFDPWRALREHSHELLAMTAARDELANLLSGLVHRLERGGAYTARIAELRAVGKGDK